MAAGAPLAPVKAAGFRTPLAASALTAAPTVTGSKNASWRVPAGAVTVMVQSNPCCSGTKAQGMKKYACE